MDSKTIFHIEIIAGRGIITSPEVDYLQTIQLHVLFDGVCHRSDRLEFASPDPVIQFQANFHLK